MIENVMKQYEEFRFKELQRKQKEVIESKSMQEAENATADFDSVEHNDYNSKFRQLDEQFDPIQVRNRKTMLARNFQSKLTQMYEKELKRLSNSSDPYEVNKSETMERLDYLKEITPARVWEEVRKIYSDYEKFATPDWVYGGYIKVILNDPKGKAAAEAQGVDTSEEALRARAERISARNYVEFKKISDNFQLLAEAAVPEINIIEGIKITGIDESSLDTEAAEVGKDNWMTQFRQVSAEESLTPLIRALISNIAQKRGNTYVRDDLGNVLYYPATYVHNTLMEGLMDMIDEDDLIPTMEKMSITKQWLEPLVNHLKKPNNPQLLSQFFQCYFKTFSNLFIQSKKYNSNGTFNLLPYQINMAEGVEYLLDKWRDTIESGVVIGDPNLTVYDHTGMPVTENAKRLYEKAMQLSRAIWDRSRDAYHHEITDTEKRTMADQVSKTLVNVGIEVSGEDLFNSIKKYEAEHENNEGVTVLENVVSNIIGISEIIEEQGDWKYKDVVNSAWYEYKGLAKTLRHVLTTSIESSVREGDKTYYSHVNPSYIDILMKKLKNVNPNKKISKEDAEISQELAEEYVGIVGKDRNREAKTKLTYFTKFLLDEFGQYDMFYDKTGGWNGEGEFINSILEGVRKGVPHMEFNETLLDTKVVLHSGKVAVEDMDAAQTDIMLLTEYVEGDAADDTKAYFSFPVFSNTGCAMFFKWRKSFLDTWSWYDPKSNKGFEMFGKHVFAEWQRIQKVKKRAELIKQHRLKPIINYDITYNPDGSVKRLGGAAFCNFPTLNDVRISVTELKETYEIDLNDSSYSSEAKKFIKDMIKAKGETLSFEDIVSCLQMIGDKDQTIDFCDRVITKDKVEGLASNLKQYEKNKTIVNTENKTQEQWLQEIIDDEDYDENEKEELINNKTYQTIQYYGECYDINPKYCENQSGKLSMDSLIDFYFDHELMSLEMMQLIAGDMAFYKNIEDYHKRIKEAYATGARFDTKAIYRGERVGTEKETFIILNDEMITSELYTTIQSLVDDWVAEGKINEIDKDVVLNRFKSYINTNVADGQALRSLKGYRKLQIMQGQWSGAEEQAIERFRTGKWSMDDFYTLTQTKKNFTYSMEERDDGLGGKMKVGIQHKNSEYMLLAAVEAMCGDKNKYMSPKLKALAKYMDEHDIDVAMFESASKVGTTGAVDLTYKRGPVEVELDGKTVEFNSADALREELNKRVQAGEMTVKELNEILDPFMIKTEKDVLEALDLTKAEDPNFIQTISYRNMMIAAATPEHMIDHVALFGTQIRKLMTADIPDGAAFSLDEVFSADELPEVIKLTGGDIDFRTKKLTKKQWLQFYQELITANIMDSASKVSSELSDIRKLSDFLVRETKNNPKYGPEIARACMLIKRDGKEVFNVPLHDQTQAERVENAIFSMIKNNITKQRVSGGAAIQVSAFGLTDKVHVVMTDNTGKEYRYGEAPEGTDVRVKYFECMMPAYTKKFFEPLMGSDGQLDISKVPEELLRCIGYRIPTEDKYSMAPLKIVGFMPQSSGSAIILPAEITTIAGSDFDVDKLYLMFPEFNVKKTIDYQKAWKDFYNTAEGSRYKEASGKALWEQFKQDLKTELIDAGKFDERLYNKYIFNKQIFKIYKEELKKNNGGKSLIKAFLADESKNDLQNKFNEWLSERKELYTNTTFEKVKYDFGKTPMENRRAARNNMTLDLIWSSLTNPANTEAMLTPGGFDNVVHAASLQEVIDNYSKKELLDILGLKPSEANQIIPKLRKADPKLIEKLSKQLVSRMDPFSPSTYTHFQQANMAGNNLVGVYASNNANHAVMQHMNMGIKEEYQFTINGHKATSLNSIKAFDGLNISRRLASFLAAAVDNAKNPVLGKLYQNIETSGITTYLIRCGFDETTIGLLLSTPIVQRILDAQRNAMYDGLTRDQATQKVFASLEKMNAEDVSMPSATDEDFGLLIFDKDEEEKSDAYKKAEAKVAGLFSLVQDQAKTFRTMTSQMNSDTSNGSAGPRVSDALIKIRKIEKLQNASQKDDNYFTGDFTVKEKHLDYKECLKTPVPFLWAFTAVNTFGVRNMLSKYFPAFQHKYITAIKTLENLEGFTYTNKDVQAFINAAQNYGMSAYSPFCGRKPGEEYNVKDVVAYRKKYIENFPAVFKKFKEEHEEYCASNNFLEQLTFYKPTALGAIPVIKFHNSAKITKDSRDSIKASWAAMAYHKDKEIQDMGYQLFIYSQIVGGVGFNANTFTHLTPTVYKETLPGYAEAIDRASRNSFGENVDSDSGSASLDIYGWHLIHQFIRHRLCLNKNSKEIKDKDELGVWKSAQREGETTVRCSMLPNKMNGKLPVWVKTVLLSGDISYRPILRIKDEKHEDYDYYMLDSTGGIPRYIQVSELGIKYRFTNEYIWNRGGYDSMFKDEQRAAYKNLGELYNPYITEEQAIDRYLLDKTVDENGNDRSDTAFESVSAIDTIRLEFGQ